MDIKRTGSRPSRRGPAEYFTGYVRIDPLFDAPKSSELPALSLLDEAGAPIRLARL